MSNKHYDLQLKIKTRKFYNEETMFGIYYCTPLHYNTEITNKYGTVSIQGNSRKLAEGELYNIKFEGAYVHPVYGDYYKIVEVEPEKLNTVSEQDKFLRTILADNHFSSLKKAYPNDLLVDLILSDSIDTAKTKGIKQKTLEKIKKDVEKNAKVSILIARLNDLELSTNAVDKILQHFGTADKAIKSIEDNIYNLCQVKSFGFLKVDEVALKRGDEPTNPDRIKACITYLLEQDNMDGHTWSSKSNLIEQAHEYLYIDENLIHGVIHKLKEHEFFVSDSRIAFRKLYNKEKSIFKHLKRIRDSYVAPNKHEVENRLKEIEMHQKFKFTDEQRNAIVEGSQHGVMVLNGLAGAGKTATVKGLIDSLGSPSYMTCALSGKAANVLLQRGIASSTIHRMLKWDREAGGFLYNEDNPLGYKVLVPDEVSMINIDLFLKTIQAVKSGSKLIVVGDSGQLPAIGCGDVLRDLLDTDSFPKFELTKVHRQAAKSGILSLANSVREGNQIMPYDSTGQEVHGELEDQTTVSYAHKEQIPFDILNIARSYKERINSPEDLLDFQVIVPNRERGDLSVRRLNIAMQEIFNNLEKPSLNRNGYEYRQGDKIIAQGNTYDQAIYEDEFEYFDSLNFIEDEDSNKQRVADVYNGTMGYIYDVHIPSKIVFIQFEGIDGIVPMHQNDLDKIDLSYAITIHKIQGSGVKHLVFALDYGAYKLLSKQLVYTALTRASIKGVALFENNAMHKAISIDASGLRQTFLADIIKEG